MQKLRQPKLVGLDGKLQSINQRYCTENKKVVYPVTLLHTNYFYTRNIRKVRF